MDPVLFSSPSGLVAEAAVTAPGGFSPMLIFMVLGMLALMFFTQSRARKAAAAQNQFRTSLQPGQRVMTQGGLIGTIISINETDDSVILQSAGSTCEYKRAGLSKLLDSDTSASLMPVAVGAGLGSVAGQNTTISEPAYGAMADSVSVAGQPVAETTYVVEEDPAELDDFALLDSITREYHESQSAGNLADNTNTPGELS